MPLILYIDFSNEDVILYMLSDKKESENLHNTDNEQINNSMREIDNHNRNDGMLRGFNIFLAHGITPNELRTLRLIYHLSYLHNNLLRGRNIDLSPQAMFQREENWLRGQLNNNIRNRRNIVIRNNRGNNYMTLYVNNNGNRFRERRYYRHFNYEPNINFLQGFIFGVVLNVFAICILMISRPRAKFKIGLVFGMLLSFCLTFPFMLEPKI